MCSRPSCHVATVLPGGVPAPYVDVENGRKVWIFLVFPSQLLLIRNKASRRVRNAICRAVACFIPKTAGKGKGHQRKNSFFFFLVAKQYGQDVRLLRLSKAMCLRIKEFVTHKLTEWNCVPASLQSTLTFSIEVSKKLCWAPVSIPLCIWCCDRK